MVKIAIIGPTGRMGKMLIEVLGQHKDAKLHAAIATRTNTFIGEDAGQGKVTGILISEDLSKLSEADVAIDFTYPEVTISVLEACATHGCALMLGTTGLGDAQHKALSSASKVIPVVQTGNTSLGVNLLVGFVEKASKALGMDFDIEVIEAHHRHKADAPSGTALMLGQAAALGRGQDFEKAACYTREGLTGIRPGGQIGFAALRGGEIIGEHRVMLIGEHERLELGHIASDRKLFAHGAIKAALWLAKEKRQSPGLYTMTDVLGL